MAINDLLSRLDKVKKTGHGRWVAKCPAHADKQPSLSIREMDDGRILLHDFAGCETEAVLQAVGLTFSDLMPESVGIQKKPESRPFTTADALRCISFEAVLVAMTASRIASGQPIDGCDRDRLMLACSRIKGALEGAGL